MANKQLNTPCVGICSTVYGDDVCRGCKRFSKEIINWNAYDHIKKQLTFDRLGVMITQVVKPKVTINSPEMLRQQLDLLGIRYRADQSAYCDVYYLLRAGASQIKSSDNFGFVINAQFQELQLVDIFNIIEQEYLALAQHEFKTQHQATTSQERQ